MTIENYEWIITGVLLVLSLATPFLCPFLKKVTRKEEDNDQRQPVSVILTVHNQAPELKAHLQEYLNQDYPADFQVVVVAEEGDSETEDILKQFENNSHLYSTFIPKTSRYMSRKKLAITIGVKAARHDWCLLAEPCCAPASPNWLSAMACHFTQENDLVLGLNRYEDEAKSFLHFKRAYDDATLIRECQQNRAYRWNGPNIAFRKSDFMQQDGYRGVLQFIGGEYDYLVNKYGTEAHCAIVADEEAVMIEDYPSSKTWKNKNIFYQETRKHLKHSLRHRLPVIFNQWMMHLTLLLILGVLVASIITQQWILTIAASTALLVTIILRTIIGHRYLNALGIPVNTACIALFEYSLLWHNIITLLRYKAADKLDFTTHKI